MWRCNSFVTFALNMLTPTITITNIIIAVTAIVSIIAFSSPELMHKWIFSPYEARYHRQYYRFITSGFLHANWIHLFFNMFVLYQFGNEVENRYGYFFDARGLYYYIMLYLGALIVSNLPSYFKYHNDPGYQSLGASGAVSAVLFTFIIIDPFAKIALFGLLAFPAIVWGVIYLAYEYWASKKQLDNIGHDAHFMGAVYGVLFSILIKPSLVTELVNKLTSLF
jgi:membrane associated rhomboid family serine protease